MINNILIFFRLVICGAFLTVSFSQSLIAQYGEIGGWVGVSHYFGDLNPEFKFPKPGPAGGLGGRLNLTNRTSLKAGINYTLLRADDADSDDIFQQIRNLSFKSNVFEIFTQFEFNFLPFIPGSKDNFFSPYLFGGLNVFNFNPQAELDGTWYRLRSMGTEGQRPGEEYSLTQVGIVYGMGARWALNRQWSINLELSSRKLFTDYLDDVSTTYPNPDDLLRNRGEIALALSDRSSDSNGFPIYLNEPGRQRGDPAGNDFYVLLQIALMYHLGDVVCPSIPVQLFSR
jgi:hypothetical protein